MAKKKRTLRVLTAVLAMVMMISTVITGHLSALGTTYYGSSPSIKQLNNKIDVGTESLYNKAVMYKLPDTVKEADDISVIITTKSVTLLDAYDAAKTGTSFGEYTLTEDADVIRDSINAETERVKSKLDGISYTLGERYDTLIAGFEIIIKAADFERVCRAVGNEASVHVGEVYNTADTQLVEKLGMVRRHKYILTMGGQQSILQGLLIVRQ